MPDLEIAAARRDAAIKTLGLTDRDMISVLITPQHAECVYLVRQPNGEPALTSDGLSIATRTVIHPFVNL